MIRGDRAELILGSSAAQIAESIRRLTRSPRGSAVRGGSDFAVGGRAGGAVRVTSSTITPEQAEMFAVDLRAVLHSEGT